jgi:hypothetical protein
VDITLVSTVNIAEMVGEDRTRRASRARERRLGAGGGPLQDLLVGGDPVLEDCRGALRLTLLGGRKWFGGRRLTSHLSTAHTRYISRRESAPDWKEELQWQEGQGRC